MSVKFNQSEIDAIETGRIEIYNPHELVFSRPAINTDDSIGVSGIVKDETNMVVPPVYPNTLVYSRVDGIMTSDKIPIVENPLIQIYKPFKAEDVINNSGINPNTTGQILTSGATLKNNNVTDLADKTNISSENLGNENGSNSENIETKPNYLKYAVYGIIALIAGYVIYQIIKK